MLPLRVLPGDVDSLITGAPRDFSANVPEDGELRVNFFDGTGENPINFGDGTLLSIAFSEFDGGTSQLTLGSSSEVSDEQANPIGATFEDGLVSAELGTLSVGSAEGAALNETVSVPLSADSLQNVGSASIELSFDDAALEFEGIDADSSGLDLQASASGGTVSIGGFDAPAEWTKLEATVRGTSKPARRSRQCSTSVAASVNRS